MSLYDDIDIGPPPQQLKCLLFFLFFIKRNFLAETHFLSSVPSSMSTNKINLNFLKTQLEAKKVQLQNTQVNILNR